MHKSAQYYSKIHHPLVGAGRFLEQDVQVFEETMKLNYFGTLRVLKAFLPGMVRRGRGEVVLVSSAAAVCGTMHYTARLPQDADLRHLDSSLSHLSLVAVVPRSLGSCPPVPIAMLMQQIAD